MPEVPLFFDLPFQIRESFETTSIGELMEEDFVAPISLEMVTDSGQPLYYASSIRTAVCDDEVCEIMYVKLYWDLVGDYVGYDTVTKHPLTKFDHEPFTATDYRRLHELLGNDGSILKFKQKSELIDKEKVKASDVVDGTTGATAVEIKAEVVEGALYSSYTLWHLAHSGPIKNMLTANTESVLNGQLMKYLLDSDRSGYSLFAFHNFQDEDYVRYKDYWMRSLKSGMPLIRKYILKNMPGKLWGTSDIQDEICAGFTAYDVNTRTYLLNKIRDTEYISAKSLEYISSNLPEMNRNQTSQFLDILGKNKPLTTETIENIVAARENKNFKYAYLIGEYEWVN